MENDKSSQNERQIDKFTTTGFNPFSLLKCQQRKTEKMNVKEKENKQILITGHAPAAKSTEALPRNPECLLRWTT